MRPFCRPLFSHSSVVFHLSYSREPLVRLDYQVLLKPLPLTLLAGPCVKCVRGSATVLFRYRKRVIDARAQFSARRFLLQVGETCGQPQPPLLRRSQHTNHHLATTHAAARAELRRLEKPTR